jgi:hypothetical protein
VVQVVAEPVDLLHLAVQELTVKDLAVPVLLER